MDICVRIEIPVGHLIYVLISSSNLVTNRFVLFKILLVKSRSVLLPHGHNQIRGFTCWSFQNVCFYHIVISLPTGPLNRDHHYNYNFSLFKKLFIVFIVPILNNTNALCSTTNGMALYGIFLSLFIFPNSLNTQICNTIKGKLGISDICTLI